jgi:hypothetical protein
MKLVNHDFVENYLAFSDDERVDVLLQELSKAIMMFPKAISDVLRNEKVVTSSESPNYLLNSIFDNAKNKSLIEKIAKVVMITNMQIKKFKEDSENVSYRKLLSDKGDFIKENDDILKDLSSRLTKMLSHKGYQKHLTQSVNEYLNLDGQPNKTTNVVNNMETTETKKPISTGTILAIGAIIVLAVILTKVDK